MRNHYPVVNILKLHKLLISKLIFFDVILGVLGAVFLLTPLGMFALSVSNLSLLILFIILTVVYQIHLFRTYSGGATFYLLLPIKKYCYIIIIFIDTVIPIIISLLIMLIVSVFNGYLQFMHIDNKWAVRIVDIILVSFMLKNIALPILVLYKNNFLLILFFIGLVALLYGLLSIVTEMTHMNRMICGLIFMMSIEIICIKIVSEAKIN